MKLSEANLLFKSNDIRAVYGKELNETHAKEIGNAFSQFIKSKSIIVARDARFSSPKLANALIEGIKDSGTDVIDIGLQDTPGLYFATGYLNIPGAMITASHNPKEFNGIKFCKAGAITIGDDEGLLEIKSLVVNGNYKHAEEKGKITSREIYQEYVKHILSFVNIKNLKPLNAVFDTGNGMGGLIVPKTYQKLPLKMNSLYFELDGSFPNHVPNPAIYKNMKDLQKKVRETKSDFGVCLDGDADRASFVDEKGEIVDNSITACIIISNYKKMRKKVVYSSTCSKIVPETIRSLGGKPYMEKVGHAFIKSRMRKEKAEFACEQTGHFFYKDNFYADSGIITSLLMYEILSKTGKKLSELAKPFKKYFKAEEISLKVSDREKITQEVEEFYKSQKPLKISNLDGTLIEFKDFWIAVKPSRTEPLLRVNMEAKSQETLKKRLKELLDFIKNKD